MILIINGPNLNLLGRREPNIYGTTPFDSFLEGLKKEFSEEEIVYFQSNCEGEIIDAIQQYGLNSRCKGIVINPGAYSHYSLAIADAFSSVEVPIVEVHISNIHSREDFRRVSVTASKAKGVIAGLGLEGYRLAITSLLSN